MPHKDKEQGREWRRKWWAALPQERKREKQIKANDRVAKIKEFIANYKIEKGCVDCGYKQHHSALEFDHINGDKQINVCFAKSMAQAKREIEKCEVVCSNCHRVRTYNRIYPCKPDIFEQTYEPVTNRAFELGCRYANLEGECARGLLVKGRCPGSCVSYDDGSR